MRKLTISLFTSFFITLFLSHNIFGNQIFEEKNHSRAKWIGDNKILLTLDNRLNINDMLKFYLVNFDHNAQFSLITKNFYNNKVELELVAPSQFQVEKIIRGNLRVIAKNYNNEVIDTTSLQMPYILDKYFATSEQLGPIISKNTITLKLWAPTANKISVILKNAPTQNDNQEKEMILNKGVWSIELGREYLNSYYKFKINIYRPSAGKTETYFVTDPYSMALSQNSEYSQIIDLDSSELKPQGYEEVKRPKTKDVVIYESHIRDLTANDNGIPRELRGTFLGLTLKSSLAKQHLIELAKAGLTHLHLLPINDFTSVNEDKSTWEDLNLDDIIYGSSDLPQQKINEIRYNDSYNWGYDPYHYLVPEGSYATNSNDNSRIIEFRKLVTELHKNNLKVILDVVFNHTFSSGNDLFSVFDKIVPNYYYRLDDYGNVFNSSCCSDTASENKMFEKIMIDTSIHWVKNYKVDGLRFDLMSFHTRSNMLNVKKAIEELTLEKDGVDGKSIYLYGEGWNFGSMAYLNPSQAFTQLNSYGAGIGQFNDRFRDAIRGGTTSSDEKSDQGFATGLFFDYNHEIANRNTSPNLDEQKNRVLFYGDVVKIGLAGNLRDYVFKNHSGGYAKAGEFYFKGQPTGYSQTTKETVNYVSAHDGYGLWDAIVAKAPFYAYGRNPGTATALEKQQMQSMALALTILSQGVPFIEGGSEILRSKSGDVDSYNSGDWFNNINWTLEDNNWAKGLPPSFKNYNDWSFWSPRLNDSLTRVTAFEIKKNLKEFKAYLAIRRDSKLFSFKDLDQVYKTVSFIDNERQNETGFIAMHLKDHSQTKEELLILVNADKHQRYFSHSLIKEGWKLHPSLSDIFSAPIINGDQIIVKERSVIVLKRDVL